MDPVALELELADFFDGTGNRIREHCGPATREQVAEVTRRAVSELGVALAPEYVNLVRVVNGSGYDACFYPTHARTIRPFGGRELLQADIVERNKQLRKMEMIDSAEVAYAEGEGCIFLPEGATRGWIGRNKISRDVEWRFSTFMDLVRHAYR